MKRVLGYLIVVLSLASFVDAQKLNLVGTTWVVKYTTGKANAKDYQEYARMTFGKGGKLVFDNGETGRWTLKGNKLTVQNSKESSTGLVNYLEARITATTGTGTAELGMTTTVPNDSLLSRRLSLSRLCQCTNEVCFGRRSKAFDSGPFKLSRSEGVKLFGRSSVRVGIAVKNR